MKSFHRLGSNSLKITIVIGAVFLLSLTIIVYAPVDCIKIKIFDNEIDKCKTLISPSYRGQTVSSELSDNSEISTTTRIEKQASMIIEIQMPINLIGTWNVSGTSDNFPVSGTAIFSPDGRYELLLDQDGTQLQESGTYQINGPSNLMLTSDSGAMSTYMISNIQQNSFDVTLGNQNYTFIRLAVNT